MGIGMVRGGMGVGKTTMSLGDEVGKAPLCHPTSGCESLHSFWSKLATLLDSLIR